MLSLRENPLLKPATIAKVEADLRRLPHLTGDRRYDVRGVRRTFRDARKVQTAAQAIGSLPGVDEALHSVISGRFALWHLVPAVLALGAVPLAELWIATLGFSKSNIDAMCSLLDAGQIGRTWLLCSHYFAGTSADTYQHAADELGKRPGASFLSLRTHAKLLLMKLADGRTLTVESSANLRSCKNIEQLAVIGDPGLFAFHRAWTAELFTAGNDKTTENSGVFTGGAHAK